jgi:arginine N-succinyltransferase
MVIIRPVRREDSDQVVELATMAGFGLTSLPKDPDLLRRRIDQSRRNFEFGAERPGGELYLFVMEDLDSGKVVGTSCIVSKVGGFEPFYAYRLQKSIHESVMLNIRKEIPTLHLVIEHSGPCEIGGLWLRPEYRRHGNGRLLSLFRFLFMADHSERFEPAIIAEMRGVVDSEGHSPFWEALGRHFFDMEFPKADYLSVKDKRFIADLMPTCPIYVSLLPEPAQRVIGEVHDETRPALQMLLNEGFEFTGMVDIFEAGPIVSCRLNETRIVRESRRGPVGEVTDESPESVPHIITSFQDDFRACVGQIAHLPNDRLRISSKVARALGVKAGDQVRVGPLRPSTPPPGTA